MFLADENIDRQIVERLRQEGYDVVWIAELAPGLGDDDVLRLANTDRRVLVTADKDFGELVFRQGKANNGVMLVRFAGATALEKSEAVSRAVKTHNAALSGAFSVITTRRVRIRRSF